MTPTTSPLPPVQVRGGTGGIVADCADMVAMARRFGTVATETLSSARTLHGYLLHPAIVASALFDPGGFSTFEADLLSALDATCGLTWTGAAAGVLDGELRVAAAAYEGVDTLRTGLGDALTGLLQAPAALVVGAAELRRTHDRLAAAQAAIVRDPEAADMLVDVLALPTFISALAAGLPDGRGVVCNPDTDGTGAAGTAPHSLSDVLDDLAQRNDDLRHGEIDVRILVLADGSRRVIVDITGTKSWDVGPTHDITSLTTNGRALVGERTAYEQGVLAAMRAAGVGRHDKVMIVGHSEGGMVAVTTARDAIRSGEFDVTHVLTVGSPIGLTVGSLPSSIDVLALENSTDVVPHLDGRRNPDRPNVTTVTGTAGDGTLIGDHDIDISYLPIARSTQAGSSRSVLDYLHSARAYLSGTSVETRTYQIQRR